MSEPLREWTWDDTLALQAKYDRLREALEKIAGCGLHEGVKAGSIARSLIIFEKTYAPDFFARGSGVGAENLNRDLGQLADEASQFRAH